MWKRTRLTQDPGHRVQRFSQGGAAFWRLWFTVIRPPICRRTMARRMRTMFKKVEKALAQGLRPAEHLDGGAKPNSWSFA